MYQLNHYPHQKNWFQRHWKWLVPVIIVLVTIPVFTSSLGGALKDYGRLYTNPSLYENALTKVKEHKKATDILGEPIETGFLFEGEVRYYNMGNSVKMVIPIKGSNLNAKMDIEAHKINGEWVYTRIRVRTKNPKNSVNIIGHN
jgi:hypothetical protein